MRSFAGLVTGRRSKFLVALFFLVFAGGIAAQAGSAETTNDSAVRLPQDSESVAALRAAEGFPSSDVTAAVTVAYRANGLTADDRGAAHRLRERIASLDLPGTAHTSAVRFSGDGTGAVLITRMRGLSGDAVAAAVEAIRDEVSRVEGGGLRVAVTGGAAFSADLAGVFAGINGTLLVGAAVLVLLLLIAVYRSPVFWLVPFATVLLAEGAQRGAQYFFAQAGFAVTAQAAGIASVLTFGAATDYALLLVARYREELLRRDDRHEAMYRALRSAAPAIIASALTVVLALLTLLLADVGSSRALGPLGASGVLLAMLLNLTLLPAVLLAAGRGVFWPRVPRPGTRPPDPLRGFWGRLGRRVRGRPRPVWAAGVGGLILLSLGLTQLELGMAPMDQFAGEQGSVTGQRLLAQAGIRTDAPGVNIVVREPSRADEVRAAVAAVPGTAAVRRAEQAPPGVLLTVALEAGRFTSGALDTVPDIRRAAHEAAARSLVGGPVAQEYDTREAAERDNLVVAPAVLAVVLLILVVLLRAVVLPLVLIATVILSFAAALGVGALASEWIFGFPGMDNSVPLIAFVFLVALGVDYNIFLVDRARQETRTHGTADGTLRALAATGGVITSAGIVLAGTFAILTLIPFAALIQVGLIIAFGVLLDTFVVRSIIVPALIWQTGPRVWWPGREPSGGSPSRRDQTGVMGSRSAPDADPGTTGSFGATAGNRRYD